MAIIAISRGTFSGGRGLAERLAQQLGYRCLGREVVLKAAETYGIPVEKLTAELEQPPSFMDRLHGIRARYLDFVRSTLLDHALDGNLVYHGHAGHLLLRDISPVIRVRIIADMEFRIRSAMEQQELSRGEAISYINRLDKQRLRWGRLLYGVDWRNPSLYDAVLNLNTITVGEACRLVVEMTELDSLKLTPRRLKAIRDAALSRRVWAVLRSTPETEASDLQLKADGGVLTITGYTHFPSVFAAIPSVAGRVEGVKEVRCQVKETSKTYP